MNHIKDLFLGRYADPHRMTVQRGMPQGDAVSMFAALVLMEQWMNELHTIPVSLRCYVR